MVLLVALNLSMHGVHRERLYEMNERARLLIIILSGHSCDLLTSLLTLTYVIKM